MRPYLVSHPAPTRPPGAAFSNRFLRHVLLSLRMMAGAEYRGILHEVGLDQYCQELPPPTTERSIAAEAVMQLFQSSYHHLQPPLSFLFFTHMGEQMAQDVWDTPTVQALSAPLLQMPPGERIPAAWRGLIGLAHAYVPVERYVLSDAHNHYLIVEQCPFCREILGADRPICLATARFYEMMFQKLLDCSVVVREVECVATGHGRCMFAVRRERDPRLAD
jgi:hypothetical protein